MNNLEYLNQISQSNRALKAAPAKPQGFFAQLSIPKIIIGGAILFVLLMAFGILLGSLNRKPTNLTRQLYTRTVNVENVISTYNPTVKSSRLRAIGASLSSTLSHASRQLSTYLTNDDPKDDKALIPDDKTLSSETTALEELNFSLNNAKLNGILDRAYDNQLNLQVTLLLSLVSQLIARTKDTALLDILSPLYSSLNAIRSNLEAYSSLS